jgi:hypothetical protein
MEASVADGQGFTANRCFTLAMPCYDGAKTHEVLRVMFLKPSIRMLAGIMAVGVVLLLVQGRSSAQTISPSLSGQVNTPAPPSVVLPQAEGSAPVVVNAVTPTVGGSVGTDRSSSSGKSFGTAGQGLPGMSGGPALNGTLGAQDPSGKYMRPPVIPPLLCDPAIDLPC